MLLSRVRTLALMITRILPFRLYSRQTKLHSRTFILLTRLDLFSHQQPYVALSFFFFNDPATPEISTLSLPDAFPIGPRSPPPARPTSRAGATCRGASASPSSARPRPSSRNAASTSRLS